MRNCEMCHLYLVGHFLPCCSSNYHSRSQLCRIAVRKRWPFSSTALRLCYGVASGFRFGVVGRVSSGRCFYSEVCLLLSSAWSGHAAMFRIKKQKQAPTKQRQPNKLHWKEGAEKTTPWPKCEPTDGQRNATRDSCSGSEANCLPGMLHTDRAGHGPHCGQRSGSLKWHHCHVAYEARIELPNARMANDWTKSHGHGRRPSVAPQIFSTK